MPGSMRRSNLAKGKRRCKRLGDPSAAKPETPLVEKGRKAASTPFRSVGPQPRDDAYSGSHLRKEDRADPA